MRVLYHCFLLVIFAGLYGCSEPEDSLLIDLRTDYVPGEEFDGVEINGRLVSNASQRHDFIQGERVTTLDTPGRFSLALTRYGEIIATREVWVPEGGRRGVVVVITRNCANVMCPEAGNIEATACLDRQCVRPDCTSGNEAACEDTRRCTDDVECPTGPECALGVCAQGTCLVSADHSACEGADYCDPDFGCRASAGTDTDPTTDAGTDSGTGADAETDAGTDAGDPGADASTDAGTDAAPDGGTGDTSALLCAPPAGIPSPDPILFYDFAAESLDVAPRAPDIALSPEGAVVISDREVTLSGGRLLATAEASDALTAALIEAGSFSIELFASAADLEVEEDGAPERIFTLSSDALSRSLTIGAEEDALEVRLRSTLTWSNGTNCAGSGAEGAMIIPGVFSAMGDLQHIVVVFDGETGRPDVYVNGTRREDNGYCPGTAVLNWEAGNRLVIGDEFDSPRMFEGTVGRVAVYDRVLTESEITCSFEAGPRASPLL